MFKLIQVFQPIPARPTPVQNTFNTYAVVMPAMLMPILQKRITAIVLSRYYGVNQLADLTIQELMDLDSLLNSYDEHEEHFLIVNGRELSLLKRFLEVERVYLSQMRTPVIPIIHNSYYWALISDLLLGVIRATQVVNLSFYR